MKKRSSTILIIIIFLAGLSLLLYPFVANEWNDHRQKKLISSYETKISKLEAENKIDYDAEWERAQEYNEALLPSILPDSFAVAGADSDPEREYLSCLSVTGDGMMGIVEIPKIDVKLPIYHTTEEEVLEMAAGHLEGSSLPVGGEDNHSVISAHRGLPSASLFTDLDKLDVGDHFLLRILNDTLCYEVDQILVVEPEETENLAVEAGKDLVTLLTCTPYGVNTERLLVRGHRVAYDKELLAEETGNKVMSFHTNYLFWVVAGLSITALFILILYCYEKKLSKAVKSEE